MGILSHYVITRYGKRDKSLGANPYLLFSNKILKSRMPCQSTSKYPFFLPQAFHSSTYYSFLAFSRLTSRSLAVWLPFDYYFSLPFLWIPYLFLFSMILHNFFLFSFFSLSFFFLLCSLMSCGQIMGLRTVLVSCSVTCILLFRLGPTLI